MAGPGLDRSAVLTIAIANYDDLRRSATPAGIAGVRFGALFDGDGEHIAANGRLSPRATEADVRAALSVWGSSGADIGLLLWTGHCERDRGGRAHVCTSEGRVAAETLADWITGYRFRHWVVIVDGCFAGSVITTLHSWLHHASNGPDQSCVLLASANDTAPADAGRFTSALATVLAEGPERTWWSTTDRFLDVWDLVDRLDAELVGASPSQPMSGGRRSVRRVFPNPLYRPRSTAVALDEVHFLPKARGIEAGQLGWFFTGRAHLLRQMVGWLDRPGNGFFVVTGPAGTGKSAVVGRLVTLSVPEYRRMAEAAGVVDDAPDGTVPPEGVITTAFHARERRVDQLLEFVADALGVEEVRQVSDVIKMLPGDAVIVIDALDEAAAGHARRMVDEVLAPLARQPGVKVLVGTRPGVVHWASGAGAPVASVADLAAEPGTADDIAAYAARRLLRLDGSSYAGKPELAKRVAAGVARQALSDPDAEGRRVGSFLVARLVTKTLAGRPPLASDPGWEERLPSGFADAFEADLAAYGERLGRPCERTIRDLLEGLAWDEGTGVPRRVIPVLTRAVTGRTFTDDDVAMLLREAAGHLLEAEVDGWAVYRLYHERLREHFRDLTRRRRASTGEEDARIQVRIADALIESGRSSGWRDTDPYLAAVLPRHARLGDRIEHLVGDQAFLEHADPAAMLSAIPLTDHGDAGSQIRTYRRASHALVGLRPGERRLAMEIAAVRSGEPLFPRRGDAMSVRWVGGPRVTSLQTLTGHAGWVRTVAVGEVEGRAVAVSGGDDGTVRVWDLARGAPVGEPLNGHTRWVRAVAVGEVEGRAVAVSAGDDGTVRVWDLARGTQAGEPLVGHTDWVLAVAVRTIGSRAVAVSGGADGTVRVWDLAQGVRCKVLTGHTGWVQAVALGEVDGRAVVVSAGNDRTVRIWDLGSAAPVGQPLVGHAGTVRAVALGQVEGRAVAVSGGDDGTLRTWDLARGGPLGEPRGSHARWVQAVAVGAAGGRTVAVSGGDDGTVRIWDLALSTAVTQPQAGHTGRVKAVTVGDVAGQAVVVSGGDDGTVQCWDLARGGSLSRHLAWPARSVQAMSVGAAWDRAVAVKGSEDGYVRVWNEVLGTPAVEHLGRHNGAVRGVALGAVRGRAVAVSGGDDGTLRVWDLGTGAPVGVPMEGHTGGVEALAVGAVGGRAMAVSGGKDGSVRIWDLAGGTSVGRPLAGHSGWVQAVAVGTIRDRAVAVSGGDDGTVRVWDLAQGASNWALPGHAGGVQAVAVGAMGGRPMAVSGGQDGTLRVWDLAQGVALFTLPALDAVNALAIAFGALVVGAGSHVLCLNVAGLGPP